VRVFAIPALSQKWRLRAWIVALVLALAAAISLADGSFGEGPVRALAIDPRNPSILFAGGGGDGDRVSGQIIRSNDGGLSWRSLGLTDVFPTSMVFDSSSPPKLYASAGYSLVVTADGGETWTHLSAPGFIWNVATDPQDPKTLYVAGNCLFGSACESNGFWKSTDAGRTWVPSGTGLDRDDSPSQIIVDPNETHTLYVKGIHSVYRSTNGGASWVSIDPGLPGLIETVALDPRHAGTLYVGTSSFCFGGCEVGGISRSTDRGLTWRATNWPAAYEDGNSRVLAVQPATGTLYAGHLHGLIKSEDQGETWVPTDGPSFAPRLVTFDPVDSHVAYMSTDEKGNALGKSVDSGTTWNFYPFRERSDCSVDVDTLCLGGGRYRLEADWRVASQGTSGLGRGVALTADTGYFWFFNPENVEVVVKVLNACVVNDRSWVFSAGLTDVDVNLTVTDTETGERRSYHNPANTPFLPVQDTAAFSSCPTASQPPESSARLSGSGPRDLLAAPASCQAGPTTLCLSSGRFRVQAEWQVPSRGTGGQGRAVSLTPDTGYFWFFDADNVEMIVKVLAGCVVNQHFWVFAGGLTDVGVTLTVTDTANGAVQTYVNPPGTPFQPIQDTAAFAACE
jgi:photosystem II stability/assembly factor-like uncharacterized protein